MAKESRRIGKAYLYHMSVNLRKYQEFLTDFQDQCALALQKKLRYSKVNTQMGPMTLPEIGHNAEFEFPEIDQIPDHPDREVLFLEASLLNRTLVRRAHARARYQVLRQQYARDLKMLPNGRVLDMGLRFPELSRNPRVRHRAAINLATQPVAQEALDAAEREYLAVRKIPKIKAASSRGLLHAAAARGTSEDAIAVRKAFEDEAAHVVPAQVLLGDEVGVIGGHDMRRKQEVRDERIMALIEGRGGRGRDVDADAHLVSSTGKRQKLEGMQLVDMPDTEKEGEEGAGAGMQVSGGKARRDQLAQVVFQQALRKFEQNVFQATGDVLEEHLMRRSSGIQKFVTEQRKDGSVIRHSLFASGPRAALEPRKKFRKSRSRKLRDRGLRGLAAMDISLSEEESEDDRRPPCGIIGRPLPSALTPAQRRVQRLEARRQARKLFVAKKKEFFLQSPEDPEE